MTQIFTSPVPNPALPRQTGVLRDTGSVLQRELWIVLRDPFSLVFSLLQPLVFMAFFTPLLSGMTEMSTAASLQWFVPSIIVMSTLFGTAMAGSNLLFEIQSGSHERMLVAPVSRSALMVGRALKEIFPLILQALILTIVASFFGFRPNLMGLALALVLLALFGIGMGALSYALGIVSRKHDWMFWAVQQALLFPLMILSGILLPLSTAPQWIQVLSWFNPLTYLVDAQRALFNGQLADPAVWQGSIAAVVLVIIGLGIGTRAMRRSI